MQQNDTVKIGYARVSTIERQTLGLELQIRALKENGCQRIFSEEVSGSKDDRREMLAAIQAAQQAKSHNDKVSFYIYKLDRLGRHTSKAIQIIEELNQLGIQVVSIREQFDTSTAVGVLQYQMLATFAEFELNSIRQRTKDGLRQAKINGKRLGRPPLSPIKRNHAIKLYLTTELSVKEIAHQCGIGRSTLYKILARDKIKR